MDKFRFASVPGVKMYLNIFSRYVMEQEIGKQREIGRRKRRERRGKTEGVCVGRSAQTPEAAGWPAVAVSMTCCTR